VVTDDRVETVYVVGAPGSWWAFWNGHVYTGRRRPAVQRRSRISGAGPAADAAQAIVAPMPATVLRVLVAPGDSVRHGDTVVLLEAMKMELPVKAMSDGVVRAVRCREGQLVQAEAPLIDLT
jgi:biotin carboxyl carrier protein